MENITLEAPKGIKEFLTTFVEENKDILNKKMLGVYLYGSLAMGTFNPVSSDVDLQVVIEKGLDAVERNKLLEKTTNALSKIPNRKVGIGFVTMETLTNFNYPPIQEFHISGTFSEGLQSEEAKPSESMVTHLATIKKRGLCLWGKSIQEIIPDISDNVYLKSIIPNFYWSYNLVSRGEDIGVCRVPNYAVLNCCRVLNFIKTKTITSKVEGGEWGLENLPSEYRELIQQALNEYKETGSSLPVECAVLKNFVNYTKDQIDSLEIV